MDKIVRSSKHTHLNRIVQTWIIPQASTQDDDEGDYILSGISYRMICHFHESCNFKAQESSDIYIFPYDFCKFVPFGFFKNIKISRAKLSGNFAYFIKLNIFCPIASCWKLFQCLGILGWKDEINKATIEFVITIEIS